MTKTATAAIAVFLFHHVLWVNSLSLKPCPSTIWSIDTQNDNAKTSPAPRQFLKTIAKPDHVHDEIGWIQEQSSSLLQQLGQHGALHFTNFSSPQSKPGFAAFCAALPELQPCQDSLASIGVRGLLSASEGIYQAVDSEQLAQTFIGLHNDCTFTLAPPFAAFCCFRQADRGGEFLVADGRDILNRLDPSRLAQLEERKLRVRVAMIPTPFLSSLESQLQSVVATAIQHVASWGLDTFLPLLKLELVWSKDKDMLQIMEPCKSPVNCHPKTGEKTFFSGIHSQSSYLQQKRAAEAFSGVATTNVFYGEHGDNGDIDEIEPELLDHLESVFDEHTKRILMKPGDVVLLDSYQVLHGRNTFQGPREHGVIWLTDDSFS